MQRLLSLSRATGFDAKEAPQDENLRGVLLWVTAIEAPDITGQVKTNTERTPP